MAEFCLSCWNKINGFQMTERDCVLSKERDLCEGCGRLCPIIERERRCRWFYDLTHRVKSAKKTD